MGKDRERGKYLLKRRKIEAAYFVWVEQRPGGDEYENACAENTTALRGRQKHVSDEIERDETLDCELV